ncbi:Uncharacterised protein [Yersinia rohdei]|nr:Uncharacterised protein [Yersinia rohdei]
MKSKVINGLLRFAFDIIGTIVSFAVVVTKKPPLGG